MLNLLLSLAGAYALICIGARVLHRRFVYLPNCARCAPENAGLIGGQEIGLKAADGVTLIAWYLPAKDGKPTLLYFIGNLSSNNISLRTCTRPGQRATAPHRVHADTLPAITPSPARTPMSKG